METTDIRQGMDMMYMYSGVLDTVFHVVLMQFSVQNDLNIVLC